jgi:hypothetical protein
MPTGGWNRGLTKEIDPRVAANAAAISVANKGQIPWHKGLTKETDDRVAKMAIAESVAQNRPDVKARQIIALIKRYEDPKEHEKTSVGVTKLWQDPVYIAKQIKGGSKENN